MRRGSKAFRAALLAGALLALGSCRHTQPDEMSAEEHRAEADRHRRESMEQSAQFDPAAREISAWRTPFDAEAPVVENPTLPHMQAAELHRSHAEAHERAAAKLEELESAACRDLSHEAHSNCPLLTPYVAKVRETSKGVELMLKDDAPVDELVGRMRCHLAWSRTEGFPPEELPACPLYRKGAVVERTGERTVAVQTQSPSVAALIREDSRRLFGPPGQVEASSGR